MAIFSVGEHVEAACDMAFGVFSSDVHVGEKGVVREVDEGAFTRASYFVKFYNGVEGWVKEDQLHPA